MNMEAPEQDKTPETEKSIDISAEEAFNDNEQDKKFEEFLSDFEWKESEKDLDKFDWIDKKGKEKLWEDEKWDLYSTTFENPENQDEAELAKETANKWIDKSDRDLKAQIAENFNSEVSNFFNLLESKNTVS